MTKFAYCKAAALPRTGKTIMKLWMVVGTPPWLIIMALPDEIPLTTWQWLALTLLGGPVAWIYTVVVFAMLWLIWLMIAS